MSFQWIFDNAESISATKRSIAGQTITRNQTVRATSRGPGIWRFTVQLPDGMRWSEVADYISTIEGKNLFTKETVTISDTGYTSWIHNGDLVSGASYQLLCVEMPTWTIFARDQVSWSGPFVFYEALV
jgi:hypothetical protein